MLMFKQNTKSISSSHLVSITSEAAAFHGAGVEVALVVELKAGQTRVQLVQDWRKATTQGQQLSASTVEANAHGTLEREAAPVTQKGTECKKIK